MFSRELKSLQGFKQDNRLNVLNFLSIPLLSMKWLRFLNLHDNNYKKDFQDPKF